MARTSWRRSSATMPMGSHRLGINPLRMGVADAYRYATQVMVANMMARDAAEGIGAFIEKRTPHWEDR